MNPQEMDLANYFGEPISVYTRKQAIKDGVLVDITTLASEAGFKWPVAMTRSVFNRYVEVPGELRHEQDIRGRLWDILRMLWVAVRTECIQDESGEFRLLVRFPEGAGWQSNEKRQVEGEWLRVVTLKAVSGPNDDGSPCITIMLPDED